jgi:3-ketoacyl-CoA synthase
MLALAGAAVKAAINLVSRGRERQRKKDGALTPFFFSASPTAPTTHPPLSPPLPSLGQYPTRAAYLPPALLSALEAATARWNLSITLAAGPVLAALVAAAYGLWAAAAAKRRCFLLDFACYKGPEELVTSLDTFIYKSRQAGCFSEESMDFQARISQRNGVSDHCYLPPALHMHPDERAARVRGARPESRTMMEAREEAGMVLFQVVGEALARTGLKPKDIDILVVNCSLFNPTPSLSAMVVNHFKFRADTVTYNLAGMGCSAGVIAVGLAQKLLRVHGKGAYALVVSTENITQNW